MSRNPGSKMFQKFPRSPINSKQNKIREKCGIWPQGHRCKAWHQGHRGGAQNQDHLWYWQNPLVTVAKPPNHHQQASWLWIKQIAPLVKNLPAIQETPVRFLGPEDSLSPREGIGTHSNILAWRIPWTVQSMGSQRVGHHWATFTFTRPSSPYSALSNHLMPTIQQEFSLSWGHKKLATNSRKVPTLPVLSGGQPSMLPVPILSLLFILSKLTSFWNALCLEILFQPEFSVSTKKHFCQPYIYLT